MAGERVDFSEIKAAVPFTMALSHFNVEMKKQNGTKLRGDCPLPGHTSESKNTFGVSLDKGLFNCFTCGVGGDVISFVAKMQGTETREAALMMKTWVGPMVVPAIRHVTKLEQERPARNTPLRDRWKTDSPELKGLDPEHPYLVSRGFTRETCEYFGVGFFPGKGSMAGRIAFPVHDSLSGELVGYTGRLVDDSAITEENPRWKKPKGFVVCDLFNLHRLRDAKHLIVVESFWGVLWLHQCGYPNVVALTGRTMTEQQGDLLKDVPELTLMLDPGEPGRDASRKVGSKLLNGEHRAVRVLLIEKQPDQLSEEELAGLL